MSFKEKFKEGIITAKDFSREDIDYLLQKGRDKTKDQSYFLYRLNQRQLRNLLFPLGNLTG